MTGCYWRSVAEIVVVCDRFSGCWLVVRWGRSWDGEERECSGGYGEGGRNGREYRWMKEKSVI